MIEIAKMMHEFKNCSLPSPFTKLFINLDNIHSYIAPDESHL